MKQYLKRSLEKDLKKWLGKPKILILKGARQTGKTTLLKKIIKDLKTKNKQTLFFSVDLEINNSLFQDPKLLISFLKSQSKKGFLYLFLDEFQYIDKAGLFLKVIFDELKDKVQIIASGSSSLEITKNSEFLTGRKIDFHLKTLCFKEFLSFSFPKKESFSWKNITKIKEFNLIYKYDLQNSLAKYISFGSYPEIVTTKDLEEKKILLKELIFNYLQKDVAGFLKISKIKEFNNLTKILADQISNLVNRHELCKIINLDNATLIKYMSILENTYVFNFLKPYYKNIRKELHKMPKVFINDFGMRNVLLNKNMNISFDQIKGEEAENFVFMELKQNIFSHNLNFYRTASKAEIDFIITQEAGIIPLEVKFQNKIKDNLPFIMKKFADKYTINYFLIITKNYFSFCKKEKKLFLPIYLLPFFNL